MIAGWQKELDSALQPSSAQEFAASAVKLLRASDSMAEFAAHTVQKKKKNKKKKITKKKKKKKKQKNKTKKKKKMIPYRPASLPGNLFRILSQ
jgi:hypothetical protein